MNSRSEYSRCHIPRLTIDMEDWKERKHAEQKGIEQAAASIETKEVDIMEGGAAASMMVEKRKKCQEKGSDGKRRKKRKLDTLVEWGVRDLEEESDQESVQEGNEELRIVETARLNNKLRDRDIRNYALPCSKLVEVWVEQLVGQDLIDVAWEVIKMRSWGPVIAKELIEGVFSQVMQKVDDMEMVRELMEDGLVAAEIENETMEDEAIVGKAEENKKASKKTLLAKAAQGSHKITRWTIKLDAAGSVVSGQQDMGVDGQGGADLGQSGSFLDGDDSGGGGVSEPYIEVDGDDLCNDEAYYGGGMWWLDRWVAQTSAATSPGNHRGKMASDLALLEAGAGVTMGGQDILSTRIVTGSGEETTYMTNQQCSGSGKRKWTRRSGRWLTSSTRCSGTLRRMWRSLRSARTRLQEMSWKPRIMNDKFMSFNIPRAKEGLVSGAGESIMLDRMEVDKSTTTSTGMTNIAEYKNETKPGGSFEAIKDKPGKDNLDIVTNVVLPGSVDAGDVGGELQEGLHGLGSQEMDWSCGHTGPRRRSLVEALRPP